MGPDSPRDNCGDPRRLTIDIEPYERQCLDEIKKILGPVSTGRIVGLAIRMLRVSPPVTALRDGTLQVVQIDLLKDFVSFSSQESHGDRSSSSCLPCGPNPTDGSVCSDE